MVAHDMAHHHVAEAEIAIPRQRLGDARTTADEELIHPRPAVSLGEDGADDGARLVIRFADVDVAAQDRTRRLARAGSRVAIDIELLVKLTVRGVLPGEPCITQTR